MTGPAALFLAAFLAATLIPAQSEALLVALILDAAHPVWFLLALATCGNVLGSLVNWALGRFLIGYRDRRWFPVSQAKLERATFWYRRWGHASLWAAWVPLIGDPLTLAAGLMREPLWRFLLIVTLAKGGRYLVLAWGVGHLA